MATRPRNRRPFSSPHALSSAIERALERVERDASLNTLDELLAALRQAAPTAFAESGSADDAQICHDRDQRVKLLAARARRGAGLFHAGDAVQLPPDSEGRHNRRRRQY